MNYTAVFNLKLPREFTSSQGTGRYVLHKLSLSCPYEVLKFKSDQEYYLAIQDFESAIDDEPTNAAAKRLLAEVMAEDEQRQLLLASPAANGEQGPDVQGGDDWISQPSTFSGNEQIASAGDAGDSDTPDQQDAANKFDAAYNDAYRRDQNLEQQSLLPLFEEPDSPTAEPLIMTSGMQFESDRQAMAEQLPLMSDEARQMYGNSEMNDVSHAARVEAELVVARRSEKRRVGPEWARRVVLVGS